jgi:type IV secretion system protein VirD4
MGMFARGSRSALSLIPLIWKFLRKDKVEGASFMDDYEVEQQFSPRNKGLLLDGCHYRLSENESFNHLVLAAPSGAGKTTRYIIPNIFSLDSASLVITDLKGELYQKTSGYLEKQGYVVKALNLQDRSWGSFYNPLAHLANYDDISGIAHLLIRSAGSQGQDKEPIWNSGAETLLRVVISALQGMDDPEIFNLPNVLRLLQNMGRRDVFEHFLSEYADDTAWHQYLQLVTGNDKMLQSFYTIGAGALGIFNDPQLAQVFSRDTLEFASLRKQKTALYLIVPPHKLSEYSVILNIFYTQLFTSLMLRLPKPEEKSVYVLGDEWGHTSIPNFTITATTIRQYRVSLSIILQSLSQMEENYGKNAASTILEGGMAAKFFYGGLDVNTAQWAERMAGREIVTSGSQGHRHERNLFNADRVRTLKNTEGLLIYGNKEPVHFKDTEFCFEHRKFKHYMKLPPAKLFSIPSTPVRYVELKAIKG